MSYYNGSSPSQVVLGALPLAVTAVNADPQLLPGRRLEFVARDIGTEPSGLARKQSSLATLAIRIMTEMRDNGTVAFIGPDDTCSAEALVAAAWNLPMISYMVDPRGKCFLSTFPRRTRPVLYDGEVGWGRKVYFKGDEMVAKGLWRKAMLLTV
ncbi:hypothetical protein J6590_002250 [Homalodisca vitripennis]|nr:hypothetical protein J6590_002250 [Homalodisca vitripennis]